MTHTEQCETYIYTKVRNTSGGYEPDTPLLQTTAPTWFTIQQVSGNDIEVNGRKVTESVFDVTCNYRPGFAWGRTMFLTTRFGNLDVINIYESKRKREFKLTCVKIAGFDGTGGSTSAIYTSYITATAGLNYADFPALDGKTLLLAFRDGINKKVVSSAPTDTKQMQWDSDLNRFILLTGDVFGEELITVLYKATIVV